MTANSMAWHPAPHKTSVSIVLVSVVPKNLGSPWLMAPPVTLNMLFVVVSRLMISAGFSGANQAHKN